LRPSMPIGDPDARRAADVEEYRQDFRAMAARLGHSYRRGSSPPGSATGLPGGEETRLRRFPGVAVRHRRRPAGHPVATPVRDQKGGAQRATEQGRTRQQELAHNLRAVRFTPPYPPLIVAGTRQHGRLIVCPRITDMYLLGEQPAYADRLINRLQGITAQLLDGLAPSGDPIELGSTSDIAAQLPEQQVFLVQRGLLHARVDVRPLFYLREGDLLGLRQGIELPTCLYCSDEPITLIPYTRRAVFEHIHADEQRQEL